MKKCFALMMVSCFGDKRGSEFYDIVDKPFNAIAERALALDICDQLVFVSEKHVHHCYRSSLAEMSYYDLLSLRITPHTVGGRCMS